VRRIRLRRLGPALAALPEASRGHEHEREADQSGASEQRGPHPRPRRALDRVEAARDDPRGAPLAHALEVEQELARGLVALERSAGQALAQDQREAARKVRLAAQGIGHARVQHAREHLGRALPVERRAAADRVVQRGPEGPDVAAHVGARGVHGLLGADVVRRAERSALARQRRVVVREGEAEVGEPRAARLVDEDVGRLDVAVHHPVLREVLERLAQGDEEPQRLALAHPAPLAQDLRQRRAVHELHGVPPAPAGLAHVDGRDDVRMSEPRGGARLALQALDDAAALRQVLVQDLERDLAVDGQLARAVDRARGPAPDDLLELVARDVEGLPAGECRSQWFRNHFLHSASAARMSRPTAALKAAS